MAGDMFEYFYERDPSAYEEWSSGDTFAIRRSVLGFNSNSDMLASYEKDSVNPEFTEEQRKSAKEECEEIKAEIQRGYI